MVRFCSGLVLGAGEEGTDLCGVRGVGVRDRDRGEGCAWRLGCDYLGWRVLTRRFVL